MTPIYRQPSRWGITTVMILVWTLLLAGWLIFVTAFTFGAMSFIGR